VVHEGRLDDGALILAGVRDVHNFQNVETGSGAHPASYSFGTVVLSWRGENGRGVK